MEQNWLISSWDWATAGTLQSLYAVFLFIFLYGYFLYPGILVLLDKTGVPKKRVLGQGLQTFPCKSVSYVISVKNGEESVGKRIDNLLAQELEGVSTEIILLSDGSTDRTVETALETGLENLRIVRVPVNRGKPFCLNLALSIAKGEIIVFADVRQDFETDAVSQLLANFKDPSVGAVSGQLFPAESRKGSGKGMDLYWKIEKRIRTLESGFSSCIGCTGAIYALRKELYAPIPSDTLLDDVVIPMQTLESGNRVLYELDARAYDFQKLELGKESVRKARTIAGNFQMLFRYPQWLVALGPVSSGMYFSHKISRLVAPFCLPVLLLIPLAQLQDPVLAGLAILQTSVFCYAMLGLLCSGLRLPLLSKVSAFLFMNFMVYRGFYNYLRGAYKSGW